MSFFIQLHLPISRMSPFYSQLGKAYFQLGNCEKAIEAYDQSLQIKPNSANAYRNMAACYNKLGQLNKCVETIQQAIKLSPNDARDHLLLGLTYNQLRLWRESERSLQQAIKLDHNNPSAHAILGYTYINLGDKNNAIKEYNILKKLDKKMADLLFKSINK